MHYIVISSPSGGGKTTICNMLLQNKQSPVFKNVVFSISATTRQKREHELHGREYFFISRTEFDEMVVNGEFLEHASVFGNMYGTPLYGISKEKHTLFDIDFQGFDQINNYCKNRSENLLSIFLLPPSLDALRERLRARGDISEEVIAARMQNAIGEITQAKKYNFILTNYEIPTTFANVSNIVKGSVLDEKDKQSAMEELAKSIKDIDFSRGVEFFLSEALRITKDVNTCSNN